jgi:hypothetical protein
MDMEIQPRKKAVFFVWTLADPNAAAQMYLNRGQARLRSAAKADDEDVAISSHLVIDFDVLPGMMRYPTGFEDNEGISRTRVKAFLVSLLKDYLGEVEAVLEEGISKTGLANVIMDSRPGRLIKESELKPIEIEMVKQLPRKQMTADSRELYREISDRRILRLVREGTAQQLQRDMVLFVKRLKGQYPQHRIRVRWRDANDADGPDEVTKADPLERPERLLERALSHTVTLDGFRGLPDATASVLPTLAERMLQELRRIASEDRTAAASRRAGGHRR